MPMVLPRSRTGASSKKYAMPVVRPVLLEPAVTHACRYDVVNESSYQSWPRALLVLFPERQQSLRGRTADHAGNTDRALAQGRGGDAAQRDRADADLAPEIEIAPGVRALGLEFVDRGKRVLAHGRELHGIRGLDHLGQRLPDRLRRLRQLAAQIVAQALVTHRIARQRVARHAADRQL